MLGLVERKWKEEEGDSARDGVRIIQTVGEKRQIVAVVKDEDCQPYSKH